ncbi:hypothetical protein JJQ60_20330 [Aquimarina mytili]|uniref:Uncharacterized protein n=2 Tax=Aquimarina mytili TaxID=874423 RepID=A0A937A1R7_9FLAO|nr:hypothetical protein [Aquimarina mytili]
MSNSKWVRLIDELVNNSDKIKKLEFKKVQKDHIGELYLTEDTTYGFDYWQNGFEGHNSLGGWLTFKEIEFLFFPRFIDSDEHLEQDLMEIENLIYKVGQFSLDIDENGIKLICYK